MCVCGYDTLLHTALQIKHLNIWQEISIFITKIFIFIYLNSYTYVTITKALMYIVIAVRSCGGILIEKFAHELGVRY